MDHITVADRLRDATVRTYEYLAAHPGSTAREVCEGAEISPPALVHSAIYHLSIEGLLVWGRKYSDRPPRQGNPYTYTVKIKEDNDVRE